MKRLPVVILVMIVVAILATWLLNRDFSEIPVLTRALIIGGGTLISGFFAFIMTRLDEQDAKIRQSQKK
ncbi:hypothetical protein [Peribacillus alkalitolerans]|uniref:hypothetical protein n=1 Tax=Peribacillus alkalitolerans TaxID=1550385 RepID=UPI0013D147B6|nr:hypothetical protein [Peribacillus alkalitolerans]